MALATILLTTAVITAVFYGFFENEVLEELKVCAQVMKYTGAFGGDGTDADFEEMRISLIGADGTVLYDNDADVGELENHGSRPEVAEALEKGSGQSIRRSGTLGTSAYYYAVRLDDGAVLRVAKEASSIWQLFVKALPLVGASASFIFVLCFYLSSRAVRSLLEPIDDLARHLDRCGDEPVYRELVPFVNTIRKQHEDILRNARMRQDFTANVSHELKTPLTSISGYAELIEHGMAAPEDIPRFAGEIHRSAARLLNTINDIIRLSELDVMETTAFLKEKVPVYQLAENCVNMLQVSAEKHQVTLELRGVPCCVLGSREMVEETLYNLCDNAIRYNNPGGSVTVTVEPVGDRVMLRVADTGIGIPKEHQARVFERFYRVDKSRSKATGGTGLGLAIVKHIVAQHGAHMTLESEPGKGTKITILFENAGKSVTMTEYGKEKEER